MKHGKEKSNDTETFDIDNKIFSVILLLAFAVSNYIFILLGLATYLKYLSIFFSLPLSFLFVQRMKKNKNGLEHNLDNDKIVRRFIDQHLYQNMGYRYGDRGKTLNDNRHGTFHELSLVEILSSPLTILLCICIAFITFIDPIYLDVDINNHIQLLKLFFIGVFQLLLFSAAFDGIILFFKEGDRQ
jgi:hypothetical protein